MRALRGVCTVKCVFAYLLVSTIAICVLYFTFMTYEELSSSHPSKSERSEEHNAPQIITKTKTDLQENETLQKQKRTPDADNSQALEYSQIPQNSQIPNISQVPENSQFPNNSQALKSSQIPESSQVPESSQIPEHSQISQHSQKTIPDPSQIPAASQPVTLAPGDSHLPYEDENASKLPKFPKELWKEQGGPPEEERPGYAGPPLKKILFWNDAYGSRHFGFGYGREPFIRAGCRVNTCTTTSNRGKYPLKDLDAVIWHFRANDKSLPAERSPHTRYIFWMMESASYLFGDINRYNNVFNWTFTYRLDSDFPNPYGRVYRRRQPLPHTDYNYAANKTKLVAWFVSNCKTRSGREVVVRQLKKWVKVDIYGRCGPLKCPKSKECTEMLNSTYKFYLSFENSLCQDYATEKFFGTLKLNVIPVVYGLGNYSIQAPPHSYIDALSFPSAKKLAEYLLYLDQNDTAYNEYFRWKSYHHFPLNFAKFSRPYCEICERLHNDNRKSVYNLGHWFVTKSHCMSGASPQIKAFVNGS
ncbi:alpha-(1,3)-fucosyltransferase C-like isoform X2 [Penaeus japonicus]|uniref:alpha-(1,3)-fucosyltransferase C-like isoform X1 n=1 Tax=Penaeus japonicus TaxID=27405 RepID=UPI001C70DEC6|nr:alpha-(1,3)-fucosyltransferase C-like isoform X1 [Penaeus japonicus]XP_042872432.1 alpha-(1,3)-fucosyltransferase C-like isoform X2 [Penaeus japonicus]